MKVQASVIWTGEFSSKELGLIARGLRRRLREEELEEATALADALAADKAVEITQRLNEAEKLFVNVEKKTGLNIRPS